jgi:hypothetical protein
MGATLAGLAAVLVLTLAGCGGAAPSNHLIEGKNYDRSCASVADCMPVLEGTLGCCGLALTCPNTAISVDALAKYTSDVDRATKCEGQSTCPGRGGANPCMGRVTCQSGTCALESPPDAAPNHDLEAKNYDRTCASVADCMAIIEGTAGCCGFGITCPNAAISQGALPQYMSDVQLATTCAIQPPCTPPNQGPCSGRIACTAGMCALETPTADAASAD